MSLPGGDLTMRGGHQDGQSKKPQQKKTESNRAEMPATQFLSIQLVSTTHRWKISEPAGLP